MLKSKILITGSKGLIGSALKKRLYNLGFQVKGMDNSYPINHLEYGDIQDIQLLKKLVYECSGIIHLAGVSRVIAGETNPSLCWSLNVNSTQKLLEIAKNSPNNPWVIYASSREVYGQQEKLPVKENAPLFPLNIYAKSKLAAEELMLSYRKTGLQVAIIRFSNVYGSPYDHSDRVIPAFCKTAAFGGIIRIDGAHNTFDFTYIDDVITGIVKVIGKLQSGCFDLPILHFSSGQGTTLLQVATLVKSISDQQIEFLHASSRSFDVSTFYGDPSLANKVLDWRTKINIKEGISRLVEDFKIKMFHYNSLSSCSI